jgi:hypothetical protein
MSGLRTYEFFEVPQPAVLCKSIRQHGVGGIGVREVGARRQANRTMDDTETFRRRVWT